MQSNDTQRSPSICSSVTPDFLDDFFNGTVSGYENYPAWFVDVGKNRINIVRQESGMNPLAALSKACKYSLEFMY